MDLIEQSIWDKNYSNIKIAELTDNDFLVNFINEKFPGKVYDKSMIEIGCFPGKYLSVFGSKGYQINGIDLTPRTDELKDALSKMNYKIGQIIRGNFLNYQLSKYDLVCSLGFIEHFIEYNNIILKHCSLVDEDGILFVGTPNFRGILQFLYHSILDSENLKRHNVKSMQPFKWRKTLIDQDFEILYCGYVGEEVWKDSIGSTLFFYRFIDKVLRKLMKISLKIKPNNSWASSYCIIIGKRRKNK